MTEKEFNRENKVLLYGAGIIGLLMEMNLNLIVMNTNLVGWFVSTRK